MNKLVLNAAQMVAPAAFKLIKEKSPEIKAGFARISKPAGKKMRKLRRIDDTGLKMPKYDLDRLTKRYMDKKLIPEMYKYLSNELAQHEGIIKQHPKNFDRIFEKLVKVKKMNKAAPLIERYETARDEYLKAGRK